MMRDGKRDKAKLDEFAAADLPKKGRQAFQPRRLLVEEASSLGSVPCDRWPLVAWLSAVQSASVGHPSERGRARLAALVGVPL
jgi:hypothetical protein